MVAIYVGVTDGDWFRFLSRRPDITEVNFWQPVDTRRFGALIPGELFLFKLKAPDHFIAGGGLFVTANAYPTSLAWAAFGEGNGVANLDELRRRIGRSGESTPPTHTNYGLGDGRLGPTVEC